MELIERNTVLMEEQDLQKQVLFLLEENRQLHENTSKQQEQISTQREELQLQRLAISQLRVGDTLVAPGSRTIMIFVIFWLFFVGAVGMVLFSIVQIFLLYKGLSDLVSSSTFFVINLIGLSWVGYGLGFSACYAPSLNKLRVYYALFVLNCAFEAVWAYVIFDIILTVFFVLLGFSALMWLFSASKIYVNFTILPLNTIGIDLWFTCWRLFIIVATPIVAKIIQNGTTSEVAFLAIIMFNLATSFLNMTCRAVFAIYPAPSLPNSLMKLRLSTLLKVLGPPVGLLIIFAVLYIIEISGFGFDTSNVIIVSLIVVSFFFMFIWVGMSLSFALQWTIIEFFNPINDEEEAILHSAIKQGIEMQKQMPSFYSQL